MEQCGLWRSLAISLHPLTPMLLMPQMSLFGTNSGLFRNAVTISPTVSSPMSFCWRTREFNGALHLTRGATSNQIPSVLSPPATHTFWRFLLVSKKGAKNWHIILMNRTLLMFWKDGDKFWQWSKPKWWKPVIESSLMNLFQLTTSQNNCKLCLASSISSLLPVLSRYSVVSSLLLPIPCPNFPILAFNYIFIQIKI